MFSVNAATAAAAAKFTNQHFSYHISPDVTIEFLRQKSNSNSSSNGNSFSSMQPLEIEPAAVGSAAEEDEDVDSYFNPLIYCAITMEEEEKEQQEEDEEVENSSSSGKVAPLASLAKNNENSSFVCNGADSASSTEGGGGGGGGDGGGSNKNKKRFSCHICQKTFGWTTDLKRHILIHTGERPFKCTMCYATFTRNFLLQKHKTKIHQCLSPNEISQLNNNVAKNLMEIKLKMRELEKAKGGEEVGSETSEHENRRSKKKRKCE